MAEAPLQAEPDQAVETLLDDRHAFSGGAPFPWHVEPLSTVDAPWWVGTGEPAPDSGAGPPFLSCPQPSPPPSQTAGRGDEPLRRRRDRHRATTRANPLKTAAGVARSALTGAAESGVSRRSLLLAAGTATVATGGTAALLHDTDPVTAVRKARPADDASGPTARAARPTPSPTPTGLRLPANLDAGLLVRRVTYGPTPTLMADIAKAGAQNWLARQLRPGTIEDPGGDDVLRRFPRLGWSPTTARARLEEGDWTVMLDLAAAHLARAAWSSRQLLEIMVDFWSNHLNVTCPNGDVWDTRHRYDGDVIRRHALGRFEDMLQASAVHPAMLVYLNNAESTGDDPNENYARELLELHTVGIDGGYTEKDVKRSALLLTGWTVERGKASYRRERHYVGAVRVMAFRHGNASGSGGPAAIRAYLSYLANHPKTAHMIASKLAVRFVSDEPPAALVQRLAAVYLKSRTAIVPVLEALFSSPEFAASGGEKLRRPFEFLVATIRTLGVKPGRDSQGIIDLYWTLNGMGHQPLGWGSPDGYPDVARMWQSPAAALSQFNTATALVNGWWPDKLSLPGAKKLLPSTPRTRSGVITAVAKRVLGRAPTADEVAAARQLLGGTKLSSSFGAGSWEQEATVALTTTLFLSSPSHLAR